MLSVSSNSGYLHCDTYLLTRLRSETNAVSVLVNENILTAGLTTNLCINACIYNGYIYAGVRLGGQLAGCCRLNRLEALLHLT